MKGILELIKLLFGRKAMSKTLGTRTNVIRLPDNKLKRYIKEDLNIEAASDELAQKAYKDMQELVAELPRMNDAERLIFEGNLRRLANKLGKTEQPSAEVITFGTKEKVSPEGIKSLMQQKGQKAPPGTLMGNLESRVKQLEASGEDLSKMKGQTLDEIMGDVASSQQGMKQLQREGLVRATARDIITSDIKSGKLKLPKELEQQILEGGGEPINILRNVYGEDALEVLDSLTPEFSKLRTSTEAEKLARSKFTFEPDVNRPKGSMSMEEAAKAEQENVLTPKKPEEPEEFATGGIVNREGFKFGTKFGRFWKIAKKVWDDINPTGDRKYDAQLVADQLSEEIFKTSMDDLPQKVQIDLYALAYNNAPKVDTLFTNPQNLSEAAKKGIAGSKEMESLGLDASKQSDFFKYENMKLSGELGPEQQVQAYKDKIRDEFSGMIDDTLMKQVEVDDDPQRLAEIYASIKEGLTMQQKGMTPEEIIRVMKQTPRTKNATGGRIGFQKGTPAIFDQLEMDVPYPYGHKVKTSSKGLDYLTGVERREYAEGSTYDRYMSYLAALENQPTPTTVNPITNNNLLYYQYNNPTDGNPTVEAPTQPGTLGGLAKALSGFAFGIPAGVASLASQAITGKTPMQLAINAFNTLTGGGYGGRNVGYGVDSVAGMASGPTHGVDDVNSQSVGADASAGGDAGAAAASAAGANDGPDTGGSFAQGGRVKYLKGGLSYLMGL